MTADESEAPGFATSRQEARDPVEVLAEEFLERRRRGERPTVEEYAGRHPELAARIEDLFPALLAMEDAGPGDETGTEPVSKGRDSAPERLGEYRVLREIGRGGMGVVYEAEQETLGRRVALKVLLHGAFSDDTELERFRREARAAAHLHHTNIVPVFGFGEADGIHFYAMQYIHGQSLAGVLSEVRRMRSGGGELDNADTPADGSSHGLLTGHTPSGGGAPGDYHRNVVALGLQAAEALAYAHGEGILHRDVKPSNLLLDTRGFLWITDFGLAKASDSGELTARGNVVGTLRYMAPERLGGAEDARSDVYSLGVTLYEALTLRPAFDSTDKARLIHDLATHEPPPPRCIDRGIPLDLETIILRAIAKDPRDRYPAAIDLADDLRRFLGNEPVKARRASLAERLWRWSQRNPTVALLSGAVVVLLAALAVGGLLSARSLRKQRDETFGLLMASKLEEGRAWQRSGSLGQRTRSLFAFREASRGSRGLTLRNEVIGSLTLKDMEVEGTWEMPEGWLYPDQHLERSASRGPENTILVRAGWPSLETIAVLPGSREPARYMFFSPSSRFLATLHGEERGLVIIWDLETKKAVLELPTVPAGIPIAFHPREDAIALADANGISIRSFPGGGEIRRFPAGPRCNEMYFDPQGRRLAVIPADANAHVVRIHDTETGLVTARLHHGEGVGHAAWHPGGGLVATSCTDFKVYVWESATGRRIRVLEGHAAEVTRVAFSHDGAVLASTGWDDQTFLWDALSWERLVAAPGVYQAFSRDDTRLGFREGSRKLGIWKLQGGSEYRQLAAPSGSRREKHPQDMAISADERWLAAERGMAGVRIWSLGAPERYLDLEIGWTTGVRFHPTDGSLLTCGAAGLLRWPVREGAYGLWTFGPPEPIGLTARRFSLDAQGRILAILRWHSVSVHDLQDPQKELAAVEHENAHRVEVSPSGRWIVTTTWQGSDVRIWEARTGIVAAAISARSAQARFSPDERWLIVSTEHGFAVHETGSWTVVHRIQRTSGGDIPGTLAFSRDSRIVALLISPAAIHLHRTETWEEVARLQPSRHGGWLELGPSGSQLAMTEPTLQAVKLWDIAAIRRELRPLGLDWDEGVEEGSAPIAPSHLAVDHGALARSGEASLSPRARDLALVESATRWLEIRVDREQLAARAEAHRRLGGLDEALADLVALVELERDAFAADPSPEQRDRLGAVLRTRAELCAQMGRDGEAIEDRAWVLDLDPDDLESGLEAAWLWAVAKSGGGGDLPRALIEKAVSRRPADARMLIAQGAVYYRLGRLEDAERVLEEAIRIEGEGASAPALLLLALVSHRSEKAEKARDLYRRAASAPEPGDTLGKLTARRSKLLRSEAEGILGAPPR